MSGGSTRMIFCFYQHRHLCSLAVLQEGGFEAKTMERSPGISSNGCRDECCRLCGSWFLCFGHFGSNPLEHLIFHPLRPIRYACFVAQRWSLTKTMSSTIATCFFELATAPRRPSQLGFQGQNERCALSFSSMSNKPSMHLRYVSAHQTTLWTK